MSEILTLKTEDGAILSAEVYRNHSSPRAMVIINPAMATSAKFYRHFASFLSEQGYLTITYDYRGMGNSSFSNSQKTDLITWAKKDFGCVLDYASNNYPNLDILIIGHSFGGQIPRLSDKTARIKGMIALSAQSGYWRLWPLPQQLGLACLWYVFMPILAGTVGYFPAKALKLGQNLPSGAALQWAGWCRNKDYFYKEKTHIPELDLSQLNIRFIGFSDDWMAPKASIEALKHFYSGSRHQTEYICPEDFKLKKIGHFGFFSPTMRDVLWPRSLKWLEELLPSGA